MNKYICVLVLFLFVLPCSASDITIFYPRSNTTTEIYHAECGNYMYNISNNVSGDFSIVLIKNIPEYDDVIESPHKMVSPLFSLFIIVVIIAFFIAIAALIKKVWR